MTGILVNGKWRILFAFCYIRLLSLVVSQVSPPTSPQQTLNFTPDDIRPKSREYGASSGAGDYSGYSAGYPSYGTSNSGTYSESYDPSYSYYGPSSSYDVSKKKKPPSPYPTYSSYYHQGPYPVSTLVECQDQMMSGVIGDVLQFGGIGKFGLIKSLVAATTAALLAKIPIILAVKTLLVKLIIIPIGLVILAMPILLPIFLLFMPLWTRIRDTFIGPSGTTAAPQMVLMMAQPLNNTNPAPQAANVSGRSSDYVQNIFFKILESEQCFEKLACQLGAKDSNEIYKTPVSWLLKFLQSFKSVEKNYEVKSRLKKYKDAYIFGSDHWKKIHNAWMTNSTRQSEDIFKIDDVSAICSDEIYPCNEPKLNLESPFHLKKF